MIAFQNANVTRSRYRSLGKPHGLEQQGFHIRSLELFPRPTDLAGDITKWLEMFAHPFLLLIAHQRVWLGVVSDWRTIAGVDQRLKTGGLPSEAEISVENPAQQKDRRTPLAARFS